MGRRSRAPDKPSNRGKPVVQDDSNGVSSFDRLPDDIATDILARLELKDAAKTCILSKRFHNIVWESVIIHKKNIDFKDLISKPSWKFEKFVNRVFSRHQGSSPDSLRFAISKEYASFEKWLEFARTKRVASLEIALLANSYYNAGVRLKLPPCFALQGWDALTSLSLKYVEVRDGDVESWLKLVNLESLSIIKSSFDLRRLVVNSQRLKRLEIKYCSVLLYYISINFAPNLQRLFIVCDAGCPNVSFKHVPKLSHVFLRRCDFHRKPVFLELEKTEVEKLEMDIFQIKFYRGIWDRYEQFPLQRNLKELCLEFALIEEISCFLHLVFAIVLGACPNLHKLILKGYKTNQSENSTVSSDWYALKKADLRAQAHIHECLKVVEFVGLSKRKIEIDEGVRFLKEITPILETITYG